MRKFMVATLALAIALGSTNPSLAYRGHRYHGYHHGYYHGYYHRGPYVPGGIIGAALLAPAIIGGAVLGAGCWAPMYGPYGNYLGNRFVC